MYQNRSDTAYIQKDPDCIGKHAIGARGKIFEYIAQIAKEMGIIAETASKEGETKPRKLRAGEWYQNVISIHGERGSGKTILLISACACLGRDRPQNPEKEEKKGYKSTYQYVTNDILLPIIQPEYFGPEDTLVTWVLTYLKEHIDDKNNEQAFSRIKIKQDDNEDDDGDSPSDFIERMRQDEALFSRKFSSHLAEQDVTAADFQLETLKVVESESRFLRNWRKLINKLIVKSDNKGESRSTERSKHPFLIIPIDDADLNPAALPVILLQMQILQHPNVLFLFSVHEKSLRSMMFISQLELNTNRADTRPVVNFNNLIKHKLRGVGDVRLDASDKINKFLPRKYRVEIEPLPLEERLKFKPLIIEDKDRNGEDGKNEKDDESDTLTFLQLLEDIPVDIFGNRREKNLAYFFDLSQSFQQCALENETECNVCGKNCLLSDGKSAYTSGKESNAYSYCRVCGQMSSLESLSTTDQGRSFCRNTKIKNCYKTRRGAIKSDKTEMDKELGNFSPPIPSIYVDALPKYPRALEQVYHILRRWVAEIKAASHDLDLQRNLVSHAVKDLIQNCLWHIPLLPRAFDHRIEFIKNLNPASKHPLQIDFDWVDLTNRINASGEGIEINVSEAGGSTRTLSVHPVTDYTMLIPKKIKVGDKIELNPYDIPDEWHFYYINKSEARNKDEHSEEAWLHRVPQEYFAVYNLAYDLTSNRGVFGRAINNNQYRMRDGTPLSIFSVHARTSTLFKACYCATPRWYRMSDFGLFTLAWNDLIRHIDDIMRQYPQAVNKRLLTDWVVLTLLRIHICLEMNYTPFVITDDEKERVLKCLKQEEWSEDEKELLEGFLQKENLSDDEAKLLFDYLNQGFTKEEKKILIIKHIKGEPLTEKESKHFEEIKKLALTEAEKKLFKSLKTASIDTIVEKAHEILLLAPLKRFVKQGLRSVMKHIHSESKVHALPKHHQAFKTWVEYGMPLLSNGDYVSSELGGWIVYQWIMLLITHDEKVPCPLYQSSKCESNCRRILKAKYGLDILGNNEEKAPKDICYICPYPRLRLIEFMLTYSDRESDSKIHHSHYFFQECARKIQTSDGRTPLKSGLKAFLGTSIQDTLKLIKENETLASLKKQHKEAELHQQVVEQMAKERLQEYVGIERPEAHYETRHREVEERLINCNIRVAVLDEKIAAAEIIVQQTENMIKEKTKPTSSSGPSAIETVKILVEEWNKGIEYRNIRDAVTKAKKDAKAKKDPKTKKDVKTKKTKQ